MAKMHGNCVSRPLLQPASTAHNLKKRGSIALSIRAKKVAGQFKRTTGGARESVLGFLCPWLNQEAPYFISKATTPWDINIALLKIPRQAFLLIALPSELNTVSNFKSARAFAKEKKRLSVSVTAPPSSSLALFLAWRQASPALLTPVTSLVF